LTRLPPQFSAIPEGDHIKQFERHAPEVAVGVIDGEGFSSFRDLASRDVTQNLLCVQRLSPLHLPDLFSDLNQASTDAKSTEKHYAPYVESLQRILDAATAKLDFGTQIGTRREIVIKLLKPKV
jgi:hypothetical protein